MSYNYLSKDGLIYLWSKIKAYSDSAAGAMGKSMTYAGTKLRLLDGSGAVLSEVTIDTGTVDYTDLSNKPTINGVALTGNKTTADLGITIPSKVSALTNDSNYQTGTQVSASIATAVAGITQFDYKIVTSLPTTGVKGTIYLISNGSVTQNIYKEYIWVGDKFEEFGPAIDLSGYLLTSNLVAVTNAEIDTITA